VEIPAGTPFVLEPHEQVLLRGGFGGNWAWGWTIGLGLGWVVLGALVVAGMLSNLGQGQVVLGLALLPVLPISLVVAAWPFLRSGRYWLTNLRLHWKPRLGTAVAVPLPAIDLERIKVKAKTSCLFIRGDQSVSMRYIGDLERLWGGIILFSQLEQFEPAEPGERTEEVACWPAYLVETLSSQQGMAVLRPDYFAFLPSQEKVNVVGQIAGGLAREVAGKALDLEFEEGVEAKLPIDLLLKLLYERNPESFDDHVSQVVEQQDGLLWKPGKVKVLREAFPLRPSRYVLIFQKKKSAVRGVPAREQLPFIDKVLRTWFADSPIPTRQPVWRMVKVSLIFTVPALLFAWGGYSMADNPERQAWESGLAYGFGGVLGGLGLLCWVLTTVVMGRAMRSSTS
jgi:hypothetical protein